MDDTSQIDAWWNAGFGTDSGFPLHYLEHQHRQYPESLPSCQVPGQCFCYASTRSDTRPKQAWSRGPKHESWPDFDDSLGCELDLPLARHTTGALTIKNRDTQPPSLPRGYYTPEPPISPISPQPLRAAKHPIVTDVAVSYSTSGPGRIYLHKKPEPMPRFEEHHHESLPSISLSRNGGEKLQPNDHMQPLHFVTNDVSSSYSYNLRSRRRDVRSLVHSERIGTSGRRRFNPQAGARARVPRNSAHHFDRSWAWFTGHRRERRCSSHRYPTLPSLMSSGPLKRQQQSRSLDLSKAFRPVESRTCRFGSRISTTRLDLVRRSRNRPTARFFRGRKIWDGKHAHLRTGAESGRHPDTLHGRDHTQKPSECSTSCSGRTPYLNCNANVQPFCVPVVQVYMSLVHNSPPLHGQDQLNGADCVQLDPGTCDSSSIPVELGHSTVPALHVGVKALDSTGTTINREGSQRSCDALTTRLSVSHPSISTNCSNPATAQLELPSTLSAVNAVPGPSRAIAEHPRPLYPSLVPALFPTRNRSLPITPVDCGVFGQLPCSSSVYPGFFLEQCTNQLVTGGATQLDIGLETPTANRDVSTATIHSKQLARTEGESEDDKRHVSSTNSGLNDGMKRGPRNSFYALLQRHRRIVIAEACWTGLPSIITSLAPAETCAPDLQNESRPSLSDDGDSEEDDKTRDGDDSPSRPSSTDSATSLEDVESPPLVSDKEGLGLREGSGTAPYADSLTDLPTSRSPRQSVTYMAYSASQRKNNNKKPYISTQGVQADRLPPKAAIDVARRILQPPLVYNPAWSKVSQHSLFHHPLCVDDGKKMGEPRQKNDLVLPHPEPPVWPRPGQVLEALPKPKLPPPLQLKRRPVPSVKRGSDSWFIDPLVLPFPGASSPLCMSFSPPLAPVFRGPLAPAFLGWMHEHVESFPWTLAERLHLVDLVASLYSLRSLHREPHSVLTWKLVADAFNTSNQRVRPGSFRYPITRKIIVSAPVQAWKRSPNDCALVWTLIKNGRSEACPRIWRYRFWNPTKLVWMWEALCITNLRLSGGKVRMRLYDLEKRDVLNDDLWGLRYAWRWQQNHAKRRNGGRQLHVPPMTMGNAQAPGKRAWFDSDAISKSKLFELACQQAKHPLPKHLQDVRVPPRPDSGRYKRLVDV